MTATAKTFLRPALCLVGAALLSACTSAQTTSSVSSAAATIKPTPAPRKQVYNYTPADRDCMKRAMYFESQRSSRDGLMAVGTVIMNRLTSEAYPPTICGIVAQEKQFAPGVMTRPVSERTVAELDDAVDAIIRGERNSDVKDAMFFHKNGLRFPYRNMHYVTVAGGNAFYEKRDRDGELQTPPPKPVEQYVLALVESNPDPLSLIQAKELDVASVPATDIALPAVVPVPVQRPGTVVVHTVGAPVQAPVAQVILANSAPQTISQAGFQAGSQDWMLRFDTATGPPKRLPAGMDR